MSQKQTKPPVPLKSVPPSSTSLQHKIPIQQTSIETQPVTYEMLQQALKTTASEILRGLEGKMGEMTGKIEGMANELVKINTKLKDHAQEVREDILFAFEGLSGLVVKMDDQIEDLKQADSEREKEVSEIKYKITEVEKKAEKSEMEISIIQFKAMEKALRIRGIPEDSDEDLLDVFATAFAQLLEKPKDVIEGQIERIYRVNSWIARQRKLPRDIVVYFTTKKMRNEILQTSFKKKLEISGHEAMILKEIPPKILRAREDYAFLVNQLKKQQIQFRWEIPVGVVFTYNGRKHRINTIQKAREFYEKMSQRSRSPSPKGAEAQIQVDNGKEVPAIEERVAPLITQEMLQSQQELLTLEWKKALEMKEQRMTRAAAKKQEEEMKALMTRPTYSEVVGGARQKTVTKEKIEAMLQKLQSPKRDS